MPDSRLTFGADLDRRRIDLGMSVAVFCRALGVGRGLYYRLLNDGGPLTRQTIVEIALKLGDDPSRALRSAGHDCDLTRVGEILEVRRMAAGLGVKHFRQRYGINSSTWFRAVYSDGSGTPRPATLVDLATKVGATREEIEWIVGRGPRPAVLDTLLAPLRDPRLAARPVVTAGDDTGPPTLAPGDGPVCG